jgi:trigger factor
MSAKVEKLSSNKVKIEMVISPEKFEEGLSKAFVKNRGKFNIPGFRRGKAPRQIVERFYGDGFLYEDAFDIVFPEEYGAVVDENNLEVVSRPDLDIKKIGKAEGVECTVEVYVRPEFELAEYKGVEAEKAEYEVKDEQVEAEITRKQNQSARWIEVDRPVKEGDRVIVDYSGSVDGEKFEGGTAENQTIEIGSGRFIPGFEEQLTGMAKGEERDINVAFPEDYQATDLAGKAAVFHIMLHDIKEKELPEIDDEFAKDVSEFETLEEYRKDIREKLENSAKERSEAETEDNVIKAVVDKNTIDIPDAMCESQIDRQISQLEYNLMVQGITLEDYLNYMGVKMEDLREKQKESAYNMVKTQLVLEAIRKKEEIEATEEETEDYIAKAAERAKKTVEEYKKLIEGETLAGIKDRLAFDKTIKLLVDSAKLVKPKPADKPKPKAKKEPKKQKEEKEEEA